MRRLAAVLILLLAAAGPARAADPTFPALTGRVVDEAGVLDAGARARLEERLAAQERATGDQVVVATLRSLQGLTIEDYANRLYRAWGLGQKGKDNGALLAVAPSERKVRIEVGYGREGVITDAVAATIIQSLVLPRFRQGDLAGGVQAGADGILELLRPDDGTGERQTPAWAKPKTAQEPGWTFLLPILFFVFIAFVMARGGINRGGVGPGRFRRGGYGAGPWIIGSGGFGQGGGGGFGGGGGGGGFSGGGGSSGGGGASGSW